MGFLYKGRNCFVYQLTEPFLCFKGRPRVCLLFDSQCWLVGPKSIYQLPFIYFIHPLTLCQTNKFYTMPKLKDIADDKLRVARKQKFKFTEKKTFSKIEKMLVTSISSFSKKLFSKNTLLIAH